MEQWEKDFWDHHFGRNRRFIPFDEYKEIRSDNYWAWLFEYGDHPDNPMNWPKYFTWGTCLAYDQRVFNRRWRGEIICYTFRSSPVPNTGGYKRGACTSKRCTKGVLSEYRQMLGWEHDQVVHPEENYVPPRRKRLNKLRFLNGWDAPDRWGWGKKDWKKCRKKRKQWM